MSYSVRHQVFVSSTYTDLRDERAEVLQAIWELDCIPNGMEAFVASNEAQWEVIKRVINECDYYVLIIGGRYGTLTSDGVSYTEKEYRYAKELGVPVLAFVHGKPEDIPLGKSEVTDDLRHRLDRFRSSVMEQYPIKHWSSAVELGGAVSRSLAREIRINPRPGWIRNDGVSPIAMLEKLASLTEENRSLREAQIPMNTEVSNDLEQGTDEVELWGQRKHYKISPYTNIDAHWTALATWDEIFRDIGPSLINEATESTLQQIISRFNYRDDDNDDTEPSNVKIALECWNEVLIQFRALGYIEPGTKKRGINDRASYWRITPMGDRYLVNLLARRRTPDQILG